MPKKKAAQRPAEGRYSRKRDKAARREREASRDERDIGKIPKLRGPKRRENCRTDLSRFCRTYRASIFTLPFSPMHLAVVAKIEEAVLRGGLFAVAMPRATGKTSILETAALWALLYGHRRFVCVIGSDRDAAAELLQTLKVELETNDLILADFPEICWPIHCLEGIAHRCKGQTYNGRRTYIGWRAQELVLPSIEGAAGSGGICKCRGILGRVRGMKHTLPDGRSERPDLVLIDDPQTDQSAHSPAQCMRREKVIGGAVLGLAGPGRKIAGLCGTTVIVQDDFADRLLNRRIHPRWRGDRLAMLEAFPDDMALWDEYAAVMAAELEAGRGIEKATAFYRKHRKPMDAGAVCTWPERFNDDEASGIQHALNLWIGDPDAFAAEYQNQPLDPNQADTDDQPTTEQLVRKTSGYARGVIPTAAEKLTAFIDVQAKCLYWLVAAWRPDDFAGWVIDWGTWPEQPQAYFTLGTLRKTLGRKYPGAHLAGRIRAGLDDLTAELVDRTWQRDDGASLELDRLLVDCGWEPAQDTIKDFARECPFRRIWPSYGRAIQASDEPMNNWKRKKGETAGDNWRLRKYQRHPVRYILFDANHWKTRTTAGLATAKADPGALLFPNGTPYQLRMIAEHCTAETPVETSAAKGRTVHVWKLRPGRDNHLWDCLVGSAVAASLEGAQLQARRPKKKAAAKPEQKAGDRRQAVQYLDL